VKGTHLFIGAPFVAHFMRATSPVNGGRKPSMLLIFPPPFTGEVLSDSEAEGAAYVNWKNILTRSTNPIAVEAERHAAR